MRARPLVATTAALTIAAAMLAGSVPGAAAKADPTVQTVAKGLVGPLGVAQAPDGTRYWVDAFAGLLFKQEVGQEPVVVYKSKKATADGVSADDGLVRFVTGSGDNKKGLLWTLDESDVPQKVANIARHEKRSNPDGKFTYGFVNTPASCLRKVKGIPARYSGVKETHPYGVASADGTTFIADAGANAVFAVSAEGEVSTVAALKPVKVAITEAAAESNKLPACTVGGKYAFEAVPTDVEVGPDGHLYVTSLPGGPEDGSLGPQGRVLEVDPDNGKVRTVAGGLLSPTGLAVAANGDIYVSQLFLGVISRIKAGTSTVKSYVEVPLPAAVEVTPTGLLATINALPGKKPQGKVVTITP